MIISRTPARVSFLGGGTDYEGWWKNHSGCVISTCINKYVWVIYNNGKISSIFDVPSKSGLATSSAHTIGLLKILAELKTQNSDPHAIAEFATYLELEKLSGNVGYQDQHMCSVGGFRLLQFSEMGIKDTEFTDMDWLEPYLMLFHTQQFRQRAGDVVKEQLTDMPSHTELYYRLMDLVDIGKNALENRDWQKFGKLLDDSWQIKRKLSHAVTSHSIDDIYSRGLKAGAIGGKIIGAGGGGCMLFLAEPSKHEDVKSALSECWHIPFKFEREGSKVIHRDEISDCR